MEQFGRTKYARQLLRKQPCGERRQSDDPEELEGGPGARQAASAEAQRASAASSLHNRKGRGLSAGSSSDDSDDNHEPSPRNEVSSSQQVLSPHEDEDEEEEEEEDSEDDDEDEDEPSVAIEGTYDPADYANLPVSTEIKDLFQYITRYSPKCVELDHSLKPFIPDFIPAVGDIDAFLKVRTLDDASRLSRSGTDSPVLCSGAAARWCSRQSGPAGSGRAQRQTVGPHGDVTVAVQVVCRDLLLVAALQRYSRDQGSSVYFPQAVLRGQDLYDVTLTDGDCRLRVTLDPGLNRLVERRVLQAGSSLRNATFGHAMSAQLPEHPGASAAGPSLILLSVEVTGGPEEEARRLRPQPLPWFGSADPGVLVPLRASRSVFLPLWNNVDYSGEQWRETPPTEEEADEEEGAEARPGVTVAELRDAFLSAHQGVARGAVRRPLIVRIINKSHLMYYGRSERNCSCPYKAVLEVCDRTGSVCVVLWNSVCVQWYRCLKPGDIIRLRGFRVKRRFQAEPEDVEISANSRNPAALISLIPQSSVAPEYLPPPPTYCFLSSKELLDQPPGAVCDVIGLLTFLGRSERTRNKDGHGEELLEYRWMRLEDGTSNQPITVKLLSTSQPETHQQLHPLSVVVCSRVKLIRGADWTELCFYLTNTTYTQVYCTGLGQHSVMNYRKLRPVRQFLQWVRSQEDRPMLSKAVIGGFFTYPPPPISLETYMKDRRGEPGFLRGVELQREMDRLCYRERRTFCVQATVTMVTYSLRGQEDRCLFWTHGSSSLPPPPPSPQPPALSPASPSSPRSFGASPSSCSFGASPSSCSFGASPSSCSSAVSHQLPPPLDRRRRKSRKRRRLLLDTPRKRCPSATVQPEANSSAILFEASMEFLQSTSTDEDEEDEESCVTPPLPPVLTPVAEETLPLRYDHSRREELAGAVALGGRVSGTAGCVLEDYYTLRLRALTDAVLLDAVFLPHSSGSSHQHSNTWSSILSHGAFSSDTPPPSPADLICTASQLANQRLVCVLEACHLGGARTELILSRAFRLTDASSQQHE